MKREATKDGGGAISGKIWVLALVGIVWGCLVLITAVPLDVNVLLCLAIICAAIWLALIVVTLKILCVLFPPSEPQPPPPSRKGRRKRRAT